MLVRPLLPDQRFEVFNMGTFGDIMDAASGGAWSGSGIGTTLEESVGDPLNDILDLGEDIVDGDLDDTVNDVLDDITGEAEDLLDDSTTPQIVYSKNVLTLSK